MATQNVSIGIAVSDNGTAKKVVKNFQEIQQAATSAQKAAANIQVPTGGTAGSRAVYAKSAPTGSQAVTEREYGVTRGAVGTGAAGRDFAKQAQGLGGLVALYATFAANIFAVGAAYEALNKAAGAERLAKATEMMSVSTGIHLKAVSKNLVEASGYALSFSEAMQFTNIGTSAGLASAQIESLTKIAKGAANALGRDVGDSIRRIIQGTAKQEQEILDELGIFVKASQAYEKFAAANKIKVADLTGAQRTQAYANEVERLGQKWNDFAEIPDPFSKFAATGKNALNDLLTSINKVFSPLLGFLSESEGAIKAIIVLISTSLTKRALPELGSLFSNIFNYDKKIQQSNANAVVTSIRDRISQIAHEIELGNKKLAEASKVPNITKESVVKSIGTLGSVATRGSTPGVAGISSTRLSTNILGTAAHPIDISKYKELADIEKVTLKTLREQIKAKEDQIGYTEKLIQQGLLDAESKKGVLVLGKEGVSIAQANFTVIDAQNKALATTNTLLADKLALQKAYNKEQSKLEKALPNSTLPISSPKSTKATATSNSNITAAAIIEETSSVTAAAVASSRKAAVDAYAAKVSSTYANATEQVTLALRVGTIPALKETWKQMGILLVENNLATASTGFFANMQIVAAGSSRILALALKGVGIAINWVLTPLLIAVTVWQLFGDSIASFLPASIQATLGIGEQGKAAEEASKKLKEYTEGTELAAMSLNKLNSARAANPETFAESSSLNKIEATVVQEQIARIKKLNEAEQEKIDLLSLEGIKKRTGLEGTALLLQQLSESTTATEEESKALQQLVKDRSALDRAIKGNYITEEQRISQTKILQATERDLVSAIGTRTQQQLSSDEKLKSSNELLEASYSKVVDALKKKGDPSLSLVTPASVDIYKSLNDIFNSTSVTANKFESAQATLIRMMQAGGKTAAAAAPLYSLLTDAIYAGTSGGRTEGSLVTDLRLVNMYLEQQKDTIAKMVGKLASATDVKNTPKTIVPYDEGTKNLFAALKNDIDETSLKMKKLTGEQNINQALEARLTTITGIASAESIAATKRIADQQAELSYNKEIIAAADAYAKVVLDRSKTGDEGKRAVAEASKAYGIKVRELNLTKEHADQLNEINYTNSLVSKDATYRNIELKKQTDQDALAKEYASQRLSSMEAELAYAVELGGMTSKEIVDAEGLLKIEKQRQDLKSKQSELTRGYETSVAPLISTLTTDGTTEQQRQTAVTRILELNAEYQMQNALILAGAEGLAKQTAKAQELKSAQAGSTDSMEKMKSITESLTEIFGQMGTNIGKVGEAIVKMAQDEESLATQKKNAIKALGKDADPKKVASLEIEYGNKATKQELVNTAKIAGATKGLFKEKTAAYKILAATEKATQIATLLMEAKTFAMKMGWLTAEVSTAVAADTAIVASKAATAPLKVAADAPGILSSFASMGPVGYAVGAALVAALFAMAGGGSNSSYSGPSGEDLQKAQGTGQAYNAQGILEDTGNGVFGDSTQKLDSINKSLEIIKSTSVKGLDYDNKMLNALYEVANAITGAAKELYTIPGIRQGTNFGTMSGTVSEMGSVESLLSDIPLIGGILGGIAGSIFGGGTSVSASVEAAGIQLKGTFEQVMNNVVGSITQYKDILKQFSEDGGWFGSDKSWTERSREINSLDTSISSAIADIFVNAKNMFTAVGRVSGVSAAQVDSAFKSMSANIDINIKNLTGEEVLTELNAVVSSKLNEVTKALFYSFEKYKEFGEDLLTTVIRVIDTNTKVTQLMRNLSLVSAENLKGAFGLTEVLVDAAGGLETFIDQATYFSENFYTSAEQVIPTQKALIKQLEAMGLTSIDTKNELRALVQGLDLSTVAGQSMYQQLMDLAPGFVEVTDAIIEQSSALQDTVSNFKDFSKTLLNFRDSLMLSASSTATPLEKYAEAKTQFERTYALALSGDKDAMGKVTGLSQTFLDTSKTLYASSEQYTRDFNDILSKLEQGSLLSLTSADVAQLQLDTLSIHTDLLSSINENIAIIAGVPARAQGGRASGLTLVGELGPELVDFTSPGRVYTADQTAGMFTGGASMAPTLTALVIEVNKLRQEVVQLRKDQQKQTGDIIISNYDANQKASDNVATAVVNSSVDSAWVDRSKATIN